MKEQEKITYSENGLIRPVEPFDFSKSLDFLEGFGSTEGEQIIEEGALAKAFSFDGKAVVFRIRSTGDIESPRLEYSLISDHAIDDHIRKTAIDRITFFLSLDDDLKPFYEIGIKDQKFKPVIEQLYGYHQVKFPTPFEGTCWAILTQRNAMPIAKRMKAKLVESYGTSLEIDGITYRAFPEPTKLIEAKEDNLMNVIKNSRRTKYLISAAEAFGKVDEGFLRTGKYEDVEAWLDGINGIGSWSTSFVMLRSLGRMERLNLDDRWLILAASKVYGKALSLTDTHQIADKYGQWQGYWAHYIRAVA
jgi:DNA-3-methyladenine glycosylase II